MEKSKVYFTRTITPESLEKMAHITGRSLKGKTAVKLHSGEAGNQNFLRPDFMEAAVKSVDGTIVECNTAYEGERNETGKHWKLMHDHGWTEIADVDILDEEGEMELPVHGGRHLTVNYVGKNMADYDSMLVLSHFKGHPMGGFGGAIKNISIGLGSSHGKAVIHGAGDPDHIWDSDHDSFLESMAEAASTILDHYKDQITFVNVMKNMSVDCDCCAIAEDPAIADIGILASDDPLALDQACLDLVYASEDPGRDHLLERIESRNGVHTLQAAEELKLGNREYELIDLDAAD